jgi:deazaflavin-dependent oxidoreductase (nitroreductase family)
MVTRLDRVLYRRSRGRWTVVALAGLPSLILTVAGRKTGEPRSTPLLCVPIGRDFIVTGSNWGGPTHPVWTVNLLAAGRATINVHGGSFEVTAKLLTRAEQEEVWPAVTAVWPAYDDYAARAGRELRMFRLVRAHDEDVQAAIDGELRLHDPAVRRSAGQVEKLLDPEFFEFGASGRRWARADMVAALLAEGDEPIVASDVVGTRLADDIVQVTYVSVRGERQARRSSVWRRTQGTWRLYFHQGTPMSSAETEGLSS